MKIVALAFATLLAGFAPRAQAQDDTLVLGDGFTLTGKVVACSADAVEFEHKNEKGEVVVGKFAASDVDPDAFYALRSPRCTTAADHLELGKFALANDMWARAIMNYNRARELDAKVVEAFDGQELPALREKTGDRVLDSATKAFAAGDLATAERDASVIVSIFRKYSKRADAQKLLDDVRKKAATGLAEQNATDRAKVKAGQSVTLLMRNGRNMAGTVKSSTADSVEMTVPLNSTEAVMNFKAKDVDPRSFYDVRLGAVKSAADRLELAKFCLENGLYTEARSQGQLAHQADPVLTKSFVDANLAKVEAGTSAKLLEHARRALDKGDFASARRDVAAILTRFGETPSAAPALELVDAIAKSATDHGDAAFAEKRSKLAGAEKEAADKAAAERAKKFTEVDEWMAKGNKQSQVALGLTKNVSAADQFEAASANFLRARNKLLEMQKAKSDDAELAAMVEQRLADATNAVIEAYVNAGSVLLSRPDYHNAMEYADKALRIDPKSSYALAFRARVEAASANDGSDWGPFRRRR